MMMFDSEVTLVSAKCAVLLIVPAGKYKMEQKYTWAEMSVNVLHAYNSLLKTQNTYNT